MKITAIESLRWAEYPRLVVVRVHTDAGILGLGESVDKIPGTVGALRFGEKAVSQEMLKNCQWFSAVFV
jgi:hypothetical protein